MTTPKTPIAPRLVLACAVVLPGTGQVLNRAPLRGLVFLFFILLMGALTLKTAAPSVSIIGKLSGGIFVYFMSILDAYRTAKLRFAFWKLHSEAGGLPGQT